MRKKDREKGEGEIGNESESEGGSYGGRGAEKEKEIE